MPASYGARIGTTATASVGGGWNRGGVEAALS